MPRRSIDVEGFGHENPIPAASRIGPLLVTSVIAPFDPGTRHVPTDPEAQVRNLFSHMGRILAEAGAGFGDVAKITFFVNDLAQTNWLTNSFFAVSNVTQTTFVNPTNSQRFYRLKFPWQWTWP